MDYDGTTPLQPVIAKLIGCSIKSQANIAAVQKEAKSALGITSKSKRLPPKVRLKIFNYVVKKYSQDDEKSVKIITQDNHDEPPNSESNNHAPVEIISQVANNEPVELYSQVNNFDNVRIAFYIERKGQRERQVIALDGFLINALASIGIAKQDVPQWVQAQVDDWTAFDGQLPITRQVKYLIIRKLVKGLGGNDSIFFT